MPMAVGMVPVLGLYASLVYSTVQPVIDHVASDARLSQLSEKDTRTPAQQKINSQLLYEIYRRRAEDRRKNVPPGSSDVRIDARGRAFVDVRAVPVSQSLQRKIRDLGGAIVSVSVAQHSILAWVPLLKLEQLAQEPAVRFIEPAAEAITQPTTKR